MKIFFDTEFTGLHKNTTLISIGFVTEGGCTFYAELYDYDKNQVDSWVRENVLENLTLKLGVIYGDARKDSDFKILGDRLIVKHWLEVWLNRFDAIEMWSDCLAYDWILFCDLFDGVLPGNVFYIPFDIATLMKVNGIDPDINREEFSGTLGNKHNALHDARVIKACYERLKTNV